MKTAYQLILVLLIVFLSGQAIAQCDLQVFPDAAAICEGDSVQLVVVDLNGNGSGVISWTPAESISDPNSAVVFAKPAVTTTYQVSDAGCTDLGDTLTVTVTVNSYPEVNAVADIAYCNGAPGNEIIFTGNTAGATYSWLSTGNINIGFGTNGDGNIPSFIAFNGDAQTLVNTIEVRATANGCTGPAESFNISVYPTPVVSQVPNDSTYCDGGTMDVATFSSATPDVLFSWTCDNDIGFGTAGIGSIPPSIATVTGVDSIIATIKVSAIFNGCIGPDTSFTITVYPIPTFTSETTDTVCSAVLFNYTATATPGTKFKWEREVVPGISNPAANSDNNVISETLINTTSQPIIVKYLFTLTPTFAKKKLCKSETELLVTVNPTPGVNPITNKNFCSGETVNSISFSSASPDAKFSWTSDINIGFGTSGIGAIPAFVASNIGSTTITATITVSVTARNCSGASPAVFTISITPGPVLTSSKTGSVCNGTTFAYTASSSVSNTSFIWSRSADIYGNNAASAPSNIINEVLNNTSPLPILVKYAFQLTSGVACAGSDTLVVTVFPKPVLSSPLNVITCDSVPFVYLATSLTPGTSITWIRNPVPGISNGFNSGSTELINESLNNTTTDTISVVYNFTLTANACASNFQDVIVKVIPNPVLNSVVLRDTVCNNSLFEYEATSTISGTTFQWVRDSVPGISNPADSANSPLISETLVNTTDQPVEVTYAYALVEPNGCPFQQNLIVTVYPTLSLSGDTIATTCDNAPFVYQAASNTIAVIFSWTRDAVAGISNPAGAGLGSLINETLDNTTDNSITVIYEITMQIGECIYQQELEVMVNPSMKLTGATELTICDNTLFTYQAVSATPGIYFSWSKPDDVFGNTASAADTSFINEVLFNNTPIPQLVTYQYTLTTPDSVCSNIVNLLVTVNPTPIIDPVADKVYCNADETEGIPFSSTTPGASFNWTSTADIGFGTNGTGAIPSFTAINTDTIPFTATIEVAVVAGTNNCAGENISFDITVNPVPKLISSAAVSICSGNELNYSITPNFENNIFYSWITLPVQFVSGNTSKFVADSLNLIPDLLIDSINYAKIPVEYGITIIYSVGANFCISDTTLIVTVNPSPALPLFTSILPNTDTITLCRGSENINFNIDETSSVKGITYNWAAVPASAADIRNSSNPNTVISFNNQVDEVLIKAYAFNSEALGGCPDSAMQMVVVKNSIDSINERKIFLKQPGNLLVYPDNSLAIDSGYQWGFDVKINDTTLSAPDSIPNQVYQVFTPEAKFINAGQLDTMKYAFWVLLKEGECRSKVYYNGPYAPKKLASENAGDHSATVSVYPNPSPGEFVITLNGNIYGIIEASLYNSLGQRVYHSSFEKKTGEVTELISQQFLTNGLYLLQLVGSDQKRLTTSIIISN